jgi:hypothetical protein
MWKMNSKDFRIGNLVLLNVENKIEVCEIYFLENYKNHNRFHCKNCIDFMLYDGDYFEHASIPLTPAVLECCGFKEYMGGYCMHPRNNIFIVFGLELSKYIEYEPNDNKFYNWFVIIEKVKSKIGNPIKYLHELQNLYYALYNEELSIDTDKLQKVLEEEASDDR